MSLPKLLITAEDAEDAVETTQHRSRLFVYNVRSVFA
jgi:hypothetical protein